MWDKEHVESSRISRVIRKHTALGLFFYNLYAWLLQKVRRVSLACVGSRMLDPLQPRCTGMSCRALSRKRLSSRNCFLHYSKLW